MKEATFRFLIIIILGINTFFIGSIWCKLKCSTCFSHDKSKFCPWTAKGSAKICPITGKPLETSDSMDKGSTAQP